MYDGLDVDKFFKFINIVYGPVGIRTRDSRISSLDKSPVLYLAELRAPSYYTGIAVQFNFIHLFFG